MHRTISDSGRVSDWLTSNGVERGVAGMDESDSTFVAYALRPLRAERLIASDALDRLDARQARRRVMDAAKAARRESLDAQRVERVALRRLADVVALEALAVKRSRRDGSQAAALERAYARRQAQRQAVESVMSRVPFDGRPVAAVAVASSVSAQQVSSASRRARVADSFDARSAEDRSTVRPYSTRTFLRDVERGSTRGGEVVSATFDAGLVRRALNGDAWSRVELTTQRLKATWSAFAAPQRDEEREPRKRSRRATAAPETRSQRDRALLRAMPSIHSDAAS